MHKQVFLSAMALTSALLAQSPCVPPNPSTPITLTWPTTGTNYYTAYGQNTAAVAPFQGSDGYVMDIIAPANISLTGLSFQLFNDGHNTYVHDPVNTPTTPGVAGINLGTQPAPTYAAPIVQPPANPMGPTTCTLNIWEYPISWQGAATSNTGWTLLGTMTGSYTGPWSSQTAFTTTTPITITAGMHGLLFEFVAIPGLVCTQYNNVTTSFTPWGPMVKPSAALPIYSDQFITVQNLGWQRNSFLDTPQTSINVPPVMYVDIPMTFSYTISAGAAFMNTYGAGCYEESRAFWQDWTTNTFSLSNHTIGMFNLGAQYACSVSAGAPTWFTPTSASLVYDPAATPPAPLPYAASTSGSWDDAMTMPITLPWSFPYPGGTTNVIEINSNGLVNLQHDAGASLGFGYYSDLIRWSSMPANFAVCYGDTDVSVNNTWTGGYGIYYDVDPSGQAVYVTFITQEWSPAIGPTQNFQLMMDVNGNVEYRYQTVNMNTAPAPILVGWTPGTGAVLGTAMDIANTPAFLTGLGSPATSLDMDARPVLGSTVNLITDGINSSSVAGFNLIGFGPLAAGIPLDVLGMPTCSAYMTTIAAKILFFTPTNAAVSTPLTIPNIPALAGANLAAQTLLVVNPGVNAGNMLTSNGLCIGLGAF